MNQAFSNLQNHDRILFHQVREVLLSSENPCNSRTTLSRVLLSRTPLFWNPIYQNAVTTYKANVSRASYKPTLCMEHETLSWISFQIMGKNTSGYIWIQIISKQFIHKIQYNSMQPKPRISFNTACCARFQLLIFDARCGSRSMRLLWFNATRCQNQKKHVRVVSNPALVWIIQTQESVSL
jgi:hypothetical protein